MNENKQILKMEEEIRRLIRELMYRSGITYKDLASHAMVNQGTIEKFMNHGISLSLKSYIKILSVFGYKIDIRYDSHAVLIPAKRKCKFCKWFTKREDIKSKRTKFLCVTTQYEVDPNDSKNCFEQEELKGTL